MRISAFILFLALAIGQIAQAWDVSTVADNEAFNEANLEEEFVELWVELMEQTMACLSFIQFGDKESLS